MEQWEKMTKNQHHLHDENQWVIQIRHTLEGEDRNPMKEEQDGQTAAPIFRVPAMLLAENSSCYKPQLLGLGPYHRWKTDLQSMDRQKLSAARMASRTLGGFQNFVDKLILSEHRLRASYNDHLHINNETLSWALAIDGCFLLELLPLLWTTTSATVMKKCTRDVILRDLILLENQVPMWVLHKLQEPGQPFPAESLVKLVREISPFVLKTEDFVLPEDCSHFLEFLYDSVIPKSERICSELDAEEKEQEEDGKMSVWLDRGRKLASWLEPVKPLLWIPCRVIANLPAIAPLIVLLEHILSSIRASENDEVSEEGPITAEEIAIPSATELAGAGVKFLPARGGPTTVFFDQKTGTFRLPIIHLNINVETALRNLIAFEATSPVTGPEIMVRYVELMNGIIDSPDDVKLLRDSGVVKNFTKNDDAAAALWNRMSRSIQPTRVPALDEAIRQVNRYYRCHWRVKLSKVFCARRRVRYAFPFVVIVLFFFMGLNVFCLFGRCEKRHTQ